MFPRRIDARVESHWTQSINPEINKIDGEHTNNADSQVIVEDFQTHTSVLTVTLIVIAVLFIIYFLVTFYKAHERYIRRSEQNKSSGTLPQLSI